MCELVRQGTAGARHGMCEFALRLTAGVEGSCLEDLVSGESGMDIKIIVGYFD
jgi:hypothetical protein